MGGRSALTPRWPGLLIAAAIAFIQFSVAVAQDNPLIGVWQGSAARFTFLADGRATGQQLSAGVIYTSFGFYQVQGDVLSVRFTSVEPAQQCGTAIGADGLVHTGCIPAMPIRPLAYRFRLDGPNSFVWGFDLPGAALFVRVQ